MSFFKELFTGPPKVKLAPPPPVPTQDTAAADAAAAELDRRRQRAALGRGSTDVTGGSLSPANVGTATLLGETS